MTNVYDNGLILVKVNIESTQKVMTNKKYVNTK